MNVFTLVAACTAFSPSIAAFVGRKAFLGNGMQPDVVAKTLSHVEDEWRAQAAVFAECGVTAGLAGASIVNCQDAPSSFAKSCNTVVSAIVQGSGGDKNVAKEYMSDVCSQHAITGWHQTECHAIALSVRNAMGADKYENRVGFNSAKLCTGVWARFLTGAKERTAKETAEREVAEKKLADEAEVAEKEAAEKAKKLSERKKVDEAEHKKRESEAKAADAKAQAAEAAARAAQSKAESVKLSQAATQKMVEAKTKVAEAAVHAAHAQAAKQKMVDAESGAKAKAVQAKVEAVKAPQAAKKEAVKTEATAKVVADKKSGRERCQGKYCQASKR